MIDTYSTLKSGIVNAIKVAKDYLEPNGYRLKGVRIDSGDMAYLSKKVRKMLDEAGMKDCKIVVSNSLDEYVIESLIHQQGAKIDSFGVGENLICSKNSPVFGGVYKMVALEKDAVINFAAESHVDRSIKNPEIFVQSNVMGTVNLLQRAKEAWYDADAKTWKEGKKYLQVSTDEVYGALGADGFFMETTPLCPHSPYSSSKASADMFVMAFHDTYGMPVNITRCSNNYGPYQFPEKLIPLMINNVKHHKQLPVYGDGMQIRDWLYVEDHCKAIDMVANGGKIGEVYNVGGHNERPNIFIVKTIINQLHDRLQDEGISEDLIKHVADRLGHDRRYGIDPTKIKNDLGWYPETPFEKGIVLTIDWYLNHQEWMDHVTSGDYQNYYQDMYKNK